MKKGLLILLIAVVALSAVFVGCKEKEDAFITVATDATWPPMEYIDENKEIVGFDIDLLNLAAKEGGFKVEFKNTAWDSL